VGYFGGVGGDGPEDVGRGVSGDVLLQTGGEGLVYDFLDGKGREKG